MSKYLLLVDTLNQGLAYEAGFKAELDAMKAEVIDITDET